MGNNEGCKNCQTIKPGHRIRVSNIDDPVCAVCGTRLNIVGHPTTATASVKIETSDLGRAKRYLRMTGDSLTPDKVREDLHLNCSAATLGRKFRAASTGANPELIRDYYISDRGRHIATIKEITKRWLDWLMGNWGIK